jgi:hypothetical protein
MPIVDESYDILNNMEDLFVEDAASLSTLTLESINDENNEEKDSGIKGGNIEFKYLHDQVFQITNDKIEQEEELEIDEIDRDIEAGTVFKAVENSLDFDSYLLYFKNVSTHNRFIESMFKRFSLKIIFTHLILPGSAYTAFMSYQLISWLLNSSKYKVLVYTTLCLIALLAMVQPIYLHHLRDWLNRRQSIAIEANKFIDFKSSKRIPAASQHDTNRLVKLSNLISILLTLIIVCYESFRVISLVCAVGCYGKIRVLGILRLWFLPFLVSTLSSSNWRTHIFCEIISKLSLFVQFYINGELSDHPVLFIVYYVISIYFWELCVYYLYYIHLQGFRQREMIMTVVSEKELHRVKCANELASIWF